jgi:lysophospholipase L1-like esterase
MSAPFEEDPMPFRPVFVVASLLVIGLLSHTRPARAEHEGKVQILLLGDSTTEGSIPRRHVPKGPHLEDVIRELLAEEKDLPPTNVINLGLSGEYVQRLLDSGRYDKLVPQLPGIDYVLIRYGLNDVARRKNFDENFVPDYRKLIAKLRKDHPQAELIVMTVIPYVNETESKRINDLNAAVAEAEKLPLFDIYPRYAAELRNGPNMLNYRRFALDKIPENRREFVKPFVVPGTTSVEVLDNRLDAHFGHLPGWYGDRHPNLAGYHVIGDETAKYLAPRIRTRIPSATSPPTPNP